MRTEPEGTIKLLFQYLESEHYDKASALYLEGIDTADLKKAHDRNIQKPSIILQNSDGDYAIVRFTAMLKEQEISGLFALKKSGEQWFLITNITEDDRERLLKLIYTK